MTICCLIVPRQDATPRELMALGAALHRWHTRESREHGMALYANDDAVNALRAGTLPPIGQVHKGRRRPVVPVDVRAGKSYDRGATIKSLRQDIPAELVEAVLVDGRSWNRIE